MPKPKQLKLEGKPETRTVKMDRISSLPDSLLCHILSFLPTRTSVATSALSRRWRHLWKDLQVLDIDNIPFWVPGGEERFVAFVNAILAQRSACHIREFSLFCDVYEEGPLTTWISTAIGPDLQELYLSLRPFRGDFYLPRGVFTCPSLESLVLKRDISFYYTRKFPYVYLPSLTNLELDINYVDPDKLLCGCPVLENLKFILQNSYPHRWIDLPAIHMPRTLKSLTLKDSRRINDIEHLEIDTPSLEYLHIKLQTSFLQVLVSNFPNMVEAHLDIYQEDEHVGWVPKLLKALCRTRLLVLKRHTTECLFRAPALEFPEFCRLLNLELDVPCFNSRFLINMLHNCHVLQVLVIHNWMGEYSYTVEYNGPSGWTPPTTVPNCVTSHLKIFEFGGYQDSADEHAFTAYLLQSGLVLETVTIHPKSDLDLKTKYDIVNGLSAIPMGSNLYQLKFD